jgi:hypothetical protein
MVKRKTGINYLLAVKRGRILAPVLACLLFLGYLDGYDRARATTQDLRITAGFADQESIAPDEPIELTLSRRLSPADGRFAVLLDATDLTSLFKAQGDVLKYGPGALPLPTGENELIVYLVLANNEWKEVARFRLRVVAQTVTQQDAGPVEQSQTPPPGPQATSGSPRRVMGFDKLDVTPSLNIGLKSQFAERHSPGTNRPDRPSFTDATIQGSLKIDLARNRMTMQSQYDIVGSSFQNEALRFAALGENAPKVDLSSYQMQFQYGLRKVLAGHSTFGAHRHLINNFASRGLTLNFPLSPRTDFSLVAMNSTSIVGWNNFFGLANRRHRLFGGIFGLEIFKERPGGLRFEAGLLDAWFQPHTNVNQGNINDTERSRGLSARVLARDKSERIRLDAGFARSQFVNPQDPLINQGIAGASVVPSRRVTRNGRYADAGFDLFREFVFAKPKAAATADTDQNALDPQSTGTAVESKKFNLTLNIRHERIEPLFKSIGANTQSDLNQNQVELAGSYGELTFSAAHTRFNDNLAGIQTILRTNTRRVSFAINTPLQGFLTNRLVVQPNPFLPRVGYTFERVRAFAGFVPTGGGFDQPGAIPDQAIIVQSLVAEWQFKEMRLGYRLNHSLQDNRALGRERADLQNFVHNMTFGWNPTPALDLNLEVSFEGATNRERAATDRTLRFGVVVNWQATSRQSFSTTFSTIGVGGFAERARTNNSRNVEFDLQWNYRLTRESEKRLRKFQTVYFVRYSNRFARAQSFLEGVNTLNKLQTFNTGVNFIFF